jgi:TonB-dependent receptor
MLKNSTILLGKFFLFFLLFTPFVFPQNGSVKGVIKDAQTKEPLPYSNAVLVGTSLGSAADKDGNYVIKNIPPGKYTLRATYVGYKTEEVSIEVQKGRTIETNFSLKPETIEGQTVVVTGQASGQLQAINEQLSSMPVKNVVSAAKIQELPDANAAESVGRLPGVSLVRTGGEASQVVIRGLAPQYNQITIDGVELPSDVSSGNNIVSTDKTVQANTLGNFVGDRAADLSMISSNMLGGIEVIKAITPDMDAALIGGVVNFDLKRAGKNTTNRYLNEPWMPSIDITAQGGYNNLKDKYNNYKFVGTLERRFLDESLGVLVQGTVERRNLSDNELGADYNLTDKTHGDLGIPDLNNLNLTDVVRQRDRYNATAVLDYQHKSGSISFMNFISQSKTAETRRGEEIYQTSNQIYYTANDVNNQINILSNLLHIQQDISLFHINLRLSHSYTENKNPQNLYFNFYQYPAGLANKGDLSKVTPSVLNKMIVPNDSNASLDQIRTSTNFTTDRNLTGSADFQTNFTLSDLLSASFKFGGMYQYRKRTNDYNESSGSQLFSGGGGIITAFLKAYPNLVLNGGRLSMVNFVDNSYSYGDFLNGDYSLAYPIDLNLMWKLLPIAKVTSTLEGYQLNRLGSALNDYTGNEKKSAVYGMLTFNIGDNITILPGVRYQNLTTNYTALRAESAPGTQGFLGRDTTVERSHGFVLPMVHVRYKPLEWLQLHFAYTNTLNYPDYGAITPRYFIGQGFIDYNNVNLKPATSENFDFIVSAYSNDIGLLSVDGFTKKIKDLIFPTNTYLTDLSAYPDLPHGRKQLWEFNTYINNPNTVKVRGIETEWQTHFWYLPFPFNGIVFSINYTYVFSEANYPKSVVTTNYNPDGTFTQTVADTFYTSRMIRQPNDIINLAFGYDYKGFSARVSMLYQDNVFITPDFWMQNRVNSDKYTRWDLSVKQDLPFDGMQLFFTMNNITGAKDIDINQRTSFPASEQHYGMTADLGLRLKL